MSRIGTNARSARSTLRVAVMLVVGTAAGVGAAFLGAGVGSALIGWSAACITYLGWLWISVRHLDGDATRRHSRREDPSPGMTHLLLILGSVGSLVAVGATVREAGLLEGAASTWLAVLTVIGVALSWFLVHALFMLRYAVLYYSGDEGGIQFNQPEPPDYSDFAYLAFDLGMTYQVSDTTVTQREIRRVVLRHSLLSYLFGAVIIGTLINLITGLGS